MPVDVSSFARVVVLAAAFCLVLAAPVAAEARDELQSWSAASLRADLDSRAPGLTLWLDTQVRRGAQHTQALFRPGVAYRFNDWGSVWLGYLFVPTFVQGPEPDRHEHRVWEDLRMAWASGRLRLSFRTRLEQRFLEGHHDMAWRIRQRAKLRFRFTEDGPLWLVLHDEVFVGANPTDWNVPTGFDQNRAFAGLGVDASSTVGVQVGYLNQLQNRSPNRMAHILFGAVAFKLRTE